MIYFIAKELQMAQRAARELMLHPGGWKFIDDENRLRGLDRGVVIVLADTIGSHDRRSCDIIAHG